MAFVTRSERKIKNSNLNSTNIGPGEYENEEIKQEARILHKISNIYTHASKKNNLLINIPFNSTCGRTPLIKITDTPDPGTYTDIYSNSTKKSKKEKLPSLNNEIIFIEENGNLIPKFKNESKGFLSSEKRFKNILDSNNNENIGPGHYELAKSFNKKKLVNTRYGKKGEVKIGSISRTSDNNIATIPDKNRGEFEFVDGKIKEIKKVDYNGNEVGPGKYNIYPKWSPNGLNWNFGLKKEDKNKIYKNEVINSFNKDNSLELNSFKNRLLTRLNKSFDKNIKKNKSNSNILDDNQNNSIKNLVFKRFLKDRKKLHIDSLAKLKEYNDIILDMQYKDTPGPGFYDNKIIKGPISIFNSNKTQNFGSNTPQFFNINKENELIGPGSYFLEKNKYEPKFETVIHTKKPQRKNTEKQKEIGSFINNIRNIDKNKLPGPGQYDLGKNFIKKDISNVKSFGILSERFKISKSTDYNKIDEEEELNKGENSYFNNKYEEKVKIKIDSKYLELKKEEEEKEKRKRDKYRDIKEPPVGTYSPEIVNSISYNVLSKVNPYRNKVAPFNIMNTRFKNEPKSIKKKLDSPGPGKYEILNAYNALYNSKKNYNIFGVGPQRKSKDKDSPGPGLYEQENPNSWNKKTFNILFMDKTNSL